jgi:hypothetical protein
MATPPDDRVFNMFKERYCNNRGVLDRPLNLNKFRKKLAKAFPDLASDLPEILKGWSWQVPQISRRLTMLVWNLCLTLGFVTFFQWSTRAALKIVL